MSNAILVVRDRSDYAARLSEALRSAGTSGEIVVAEDARAALGLFDSSGRFGSGHLPAMVIVPPVAETLALLQVLRAAKRTLAIPVFVVRALPLPEPERLR